MDSGTGSCSDSDSDSDSYSDPDTDLDALSDTDAEEDADDGSDDEEPDTEAEEILEAIAHYRNEGPAKPAHTLQTKKLWRRESEFWQEYAGKLQKKTGTSPEDQLRACDPAVFKAYLEWREKWARIKKESALEAYWKRISMYYHDVVGHAMSNEVLKDVRNWIPTLGLDKSKKEKLAMYVQELYAILHALWVDDTKILHGIIRAQIALLLLLGAATATRPGALVESASNKGSNKALWFKDVDLMKVRSVKDPSRSTLVANVNLENVKNKERDGTPKKFTFRLEGLPAFCIVSHILGIGASQDAFRDNFTDIQQIYDLVIPAERNVLHIKWKTEVLNKPFFCNVTNGIGGGRIQRDKAFPYARYRDIFVRLGRIAGFAAPLELYSLRRASGNNINSALDAVERNQTMGHLGSTYEKYYTPTHIARDFQAIYFGTPPEEKLIQSVASMGLSRDRRAPTELDDDQQKQVRNDPILVALREKREKYKKMLKDKGFYPLAAGKGTRLYKKYEKTNRKLASAYQKLHRIRLNEVIRKFHDSIDTIEIARQLSGKPATEVLTLPKVEFELRSRAAIAGMLSKPFKDDRERLIFTRTLARLCQQQETRQPKALRRKNWEFVEHDSGAPLTKRHKADTARAEKRFYCHSSDLVRQELDSDDGDTGEIKTHDLYPIVLPYPVCLICIGGRFPYERRMKHIPRKDVLQKHVARHFQQLEYQNGFQCLHPQCAIMLDGIVHFKRHALDVHGVVH